MQPLVDQVPPMTQEEATLWLDVTKRVVDPSVWEYWTTR